MAPTSSPTTADADVLIVGAGPAGLALSCALADIGLSVQIFEQQPLAAIEAPAEDGREIALTHRARGIMQRLGLWDHLPTEAISPLRQARVMDGDRPETLGFAAQSGGEPLGWLVPNHLIRTAALRASQARTSVQLHGNAPVVALNRNTERAELTLADGRRFTAPLVVAADSRFSPTRRLAGIGAAMRDFGRSVVVAQVHHDGDNEGIAWECFRYGNTLAMLPMNGGRASAVITVAGDQAAQWLALSDEEFAARVQQQFGNRWGRISAAGRRHHYPLVGVYAHRFVTDRFALIGDAAVGMHPVTAHGWNFGLYGVEVLSQALQSARNSNATAGRDLGDIRTLQRYEREHRRVSLPVYLGTNAIVSLFTDERQLPKLARRAVLHCAEHLPALSGLIKATITKQLMGRAAGR